MVYTTAAETKGGVEGGGGGENGEGTSRDGQKQVLPQTIGKTDRMEESDQSPPRCLEYVVGESFSQTTWATALLLSWDS